MTTEELARLAKQVRDAQKRYFRTRTPSDLRESKDHERRLDAAITAVLDPPTPDLFPEAQP